MLTVNVHKFAEHEKIKDECLAMIDARPDPGLNNPDVITKSDYNPSSSSQFSLSTKRNLLSNSSEFYNFSYDYKNDCLIAGVLFRREFYTDRDIEPENSIMFTISLIPFANLNSPTFKSAGKSSKK